MGRDGYLRARNALRSLPLLSAATIGFGLLAMATTAFAVPMQIPYFGALTYADTGAGVDGDVSVQARLFEQAVGGMAVWTGALDPAVPVEDGRLAIVLEAGTPALNSVSFAVNEMWVELTVDGATMTPRQRISTVPYAMEALNAQTLAGLDASAYALVDDSVSVLSLSSTGEGVFGGGVQVGYTAAWGTCSGSLAGALQYNSGTNQLELCDGSTWLPLIDAGSGTGSACPMGEAVVGINADGTLDCEAFSGSGSSVWQAVGGTNDIQYGSGNVAVGSSAPSAALDVQGTLKVGSGGEACSASLEGSLRWNTTLGVMQVCDGSDWSALGGAAVIQSGSADVAVYAYDLSNGTNGGTNAANAWTPSPLNTTVSDAQSIGTLSGSQLTLDAGTYSVEARQVFGSHVGVPMQFRTRVRNVTDGETVALSNICRLHMVSGISANGDCTAKGIFTIDDTKTFEMQYWSSHVMTDVGLGHGAGDSSGEPNRFSTLFVRLEAGADLCGQDQNSPAESCAAVRDCGLTTDAAYWLDPDGPGVGDAPFQAWCDLDLEGGGWALVAHYISGQRLSIFDPTEAQIANGSGGTTAPSTYYPLPVTSQYGHMAYTRFDPNGRDVMMTCGSATTNPTQQRYISNSLITDWTHGDKGTYASAGSPGWGHVSHSPSNAGRGNHWLCGVSAIYPQWGVAYCSGGGNGWGNHLASYNNQSGAIAIGCAGAQGNSFQLWVR